jgi:hypothetical protein
MNYRRLTLCALLMFIKCNPISAFKGISIDSVSIKSIKVLDRFHISTNNDGALFSLASSQNSQKDLSTIRLSLFLNYGFTINYDVKKCFSVFTGLGIKNIGFIEKTNDTIIKYRTYNLGVPFGIKIGNLDKKTFVYLGVGEDLIVNFKEKEFSSKDAYFSRHKHKFNEWFSDRTPTFMPYLFAGVGVGHNLTFKVQYYINNFFNTDFLINSSGYKIKPYSALNLHIIYLSLGIDIDYGKKGKTKIDLEEFD